MSENEMVNGMDAMYLRYSGWLFAGKGKGKWCDPSTNLFHTTADAKEIQLFRDEVRFGVLLQYLTSETDKKEHFIGACLFYMAQQRAFYWGVPVLYGSTRLLSIP